MRTEKYFAGIGGGRRRRELTIRLSSSAEVKNAWSYTSIHEYVCMTWCLFKQRDKFTSAS